MTVSAPLIAALRVATFSFLIVGLVTLVFHATKDKIADNEQQALLHSLQTVLNPDSYDNNIAQDLIHKQGYSIYRARKAGQPVAAIISTTTAQGYNGDIRLLLAITTEGKITGVRVLTHKETPGLGDKIELKKSSWILNFNDKTLADINSTQWAVKRDGGSFDQFTGATITPRAIVNQVKQTGLFFQQHQTTLF